MFVALYQNARAGNVAVVMQFMHQQMLCSADQPKDIIELMAGSNATVANTLMILSVQHGHTTQLRSIADFVLGHKHAFRKEDVNRYFIDDKKDSPFTTPMFMHSESSIMDFIQTIVTFKMQYTLVSRNLLTSWLFLACRHGKALVVKYLTDTQNPEFRSCVEHGDSSSLHLAITSGSLDTVKALVLPQTIEWFKSHRPRYEYISTAVWYSAPDIFKYLADHGFPNERQFSPIHAACVSGNLTLVQQYCIHPSNVNAVSKSPEKHTPISLALQHGYLECVKWLLDNGAEYPPEDKLHFKRPGISRCGETPKSAQVLAFMMNHPTFNASNFISTMLNITNIPRLEPLLVFLRTYTGLSTLPEIAWCCLVGVRYRVEHKFISDSRFPMPVQDKQWQLYMDTLMTTMQISMGPGHFWDYILEFYAREDMFTRVYTRNDNEKTIRHERDHIVRWYAMCAGIEGDSLTRSLTFPAELDVLQRMFWMKRGARKLRPRPTNDSYYLESVPLDVFHIVFSYYLHFTFSYKMMRLQYDYWHAHDAVDLTTPKRSLRSSKKLKHV